jgi:hypothetical protein
MTETVGAEYYEDMKKRDRKPIPPLSTKVRYGLIALLLTGSVIAEYQYPLNIIGIFDKS